MSFQTVTSTTTSATTNPNIIGTVISGGNNASNTVTVDLSGQASTTWEAPLNIDSVIKKYFELKGDVAGNPKAFIDAIDSLPGVDDNFKAIKLYDLLKKSKHKDFEKYAKKYQFEMPGYSGMTFSSDTNTGMYRVGSDSISISAGGAVTLTSGVAATPA